MGWHKFNVWNQDNIQRITIRSSGIKECQTILRELSENRNSYFRQSVVLRGLRCASFWPPRHTPGSCRCCRGSPPPVKTLISFGFAVSVSVTLGSIFALGLKAQMKGLWAGTVVDILSVEQLLLMLFEMFAWITAQGNQWKQHTLSSFKFQIYFVRNCQVFCQASSINETYHQEYLLFIFICMCM